MIADSELFYFKFGNEEDKRVVLESGPVFMAGRCFIVTQWSQNIERRRNSVQAVPIWVKLHGTRKELWTGDGLGYLATRLGRPVEALQW
ncbi:hypothetical protein IFM89_028703 [Coptis chinensis]|uniref:DUF4283 domain-containing protein n=1 Tax=Coptis chinensis TaxID=261450 RepID=A0A835I630_9MAGN|nr:hypothetical protein IFM89_028703 [Coptis chinensis]